MKTIGIITIALVTIVLSTILRGYALSKLWLWFIASTFGAAPLGIAQSIGLALVVSFMTHQFNSSEDNKKSTDEKMVRNVAITLLSPAMALIIGWIVKSFI